MLSYYKVSPKSIVRSTLHFEALGMQNKIVTLLYGPMTAQQQTCAKQKCRIRPDSVMRAIEWLVENNDEWKDRNINLQNIRQTLSQPALVDDSHVEDAMDSNIESTETFESVLP